MKNKMMWALASILSLAAIVTVILAFASFINGRGEYAGNSSITADADSSADNNGAPDGEGPLKADGGAGNGVGSNAGGSAETAPGSSSSGGSDKNKSSSDRNSSGSGKSSGSSSSGGAAQGGAVADEAGSNAAAADGSGADGGHSNHVETAETGGDTAGTSGGNTSAGAKHSSSGSRDTSYIDGPGGMDPDQGADAPSHIEGGGDLEYEGYIIPENTAVYLATFDEKQPEELLMMITLFEDNTDNQTEEAIEILKQKFEAAAVEEIFALIKDYSDLKNKDSELHELLFQQKFDQFIDASRSADNQIYIVVYKAAADPRLEDFGGFGL